MSDIIIHDLQQCTQVLTLRGAHKGKASGLCFGGENGDRFLTCGVDKTVKLWSTPTGLEQDAAVRLFLLSIRCPAQSQSSPNRKLRRSTCFRRKTHSSRGKLPVASGDSILIWYPVFCPCSSIDHHRTDPVFATASNIVQIWDESKWVTPFVPFGSISVAFSYGALRQNRANLELYIPYFDRDNHLCAIQFVGTVGPRQHWIRPNVHPVRHPHREGRTESDHAGRWTDTLS